MKKVLPWFLSFILLSGCSLRFFHFIQNESDEKQLVRFHSLMMKDWLEHHQKQYKLDSLPEGPVFYGEVYLSESTYRRPKASKLKHFTDTLYVPVFRDATIVFELPPGQAALIGAGTNYYGAAEVSEVYVSADSVSWSPLQKKRYGMWGMNTYWTSQD